MADSVQRRGRDAHVYEPKPNTPYPQQPTIRLTSGVCKGLVYLPLPGVRRRTIEQATLTVPVAGAWAAQTITATPIAEDWAPRTATWNNQPGVRSGQATSQAQSAKAAGERIEIDVTDHVQAVADGAKHYGWMLTTSSGANNRVVGFDSPGNDSWRLAIDFVEAPEPPTDLSPNGGVTAVEPVLSFEFTDLGGASTEQASLEVRVNSAATATGAWSSGEVATQAPQFDLAASAWPTTPTSGTTYYWQVRVKDGAGYWSGWSDWASFVYAPKPTLTVDNPASGVAWDVTPTIAAHISAGEIKSWRIRIARGDDKTRVLYDSGRQPGNGTNALAHTIPFRNDDDRRILRDDSDYWLNVRVWDRLDRETTSGDPAWTQEWTLFHLDDDLTPTPPETLHVVQVAETPRVRLTWERSTGFPEGWIIRRDGQNIARLDPDEVDVDGDIYTWVDSGASPWMQHEWAVKVIDGGKRSADSPVATLTPEVAGVWLLTDDAEVVLDGVDVGELRTSDKRARYVPLNRAHDFDIVHALGGITGGYTGAIADTRGRDLDADRALLLDMRQHPHRRVQLVYGTVNVPVRLANVSVTPSPDMLPGRREHVVSFEATQTGDFDEVGG